MLHRLAPVPRGASLRNRPWVPSSMNSGNGGNRGAEDRQVLACRLHQHIGQPVAVPVRGYAGGQHKKLRVAHGGDHLGLVAGTAPCDAVSEMPCCAARARISASSAPPPICVQCQSRVFRQQGKRVDEVVESPSFPPAVPPTSCGRDRRAGGGPPGPAVQETATVPARDRQGPPGPARSASDCRCSAPKRVQVAPKAAP